MNKKEYGLVMRHLIAVLIYGSAFLIVNDLFWKELLFGLVLIVGGLVQHG